MEFRLLGPVEVIRNGDPVPIAGRRERTMLALLLLAEGRIVPVDRLIDLVWGDTPPPTVRRQVHACMSSLRTAVGDALQAREPGYRLRVPPDRVDVHIFDTLVAQARQDSAEGRHGDAADRMRSALSLWRGPALGGLPGLAGERVRLEERRMAAVQVRIDADLAQGRHGDLIPELTALAGEHPLHEGLHARLVLAYYRSGRVAEALAAYRAGRQALLDGLGLEPSAELRGLEKAILTEDPDLGPAGVQFTTVAGGQRPPDRRSGGVPALLPPDLADFTGRAGEIELLREALTTQGGHAVPVCAIAGPGGVGKTTLAVHVAHELKEVFRDGQLYVNLHGVSGQPADPVEVLARFLRALGVDGPAIPGDPDERIELYRDRLANRRLLVLLDNAAGEEQLTPLLPGEARCGVLVTSRARLGGLGGARLIDLEVFEPAQAIRLLARIAGTQRAAAEPAAATNIVAACGHLPLAVRIAGARLASRPHWQLATLAARLGDRTHRLNELSHGGMAVRVSIALSYRGLDAVARVLFRRLGLLEAPEFAGWVAAALLDVPLGVGEQVAEHLVDARLLEAAGTGVDGSTRYRFHDLIGAYARERAHAEESPDGRQAALERAFGAWLHLAEQAHRRVYGGDYHILHGSAPRWPLPADISDRLLADPLGWLESERFGLLATVRQAAAVGLDELTWDLVQSSVTLFATRWYLDDWGQANEQALAATRRAGNRRGEAAILWSISAWHEAHSRFGDALEYIESAIAHLDEAGEPIDHGVLFSSASHTARRLGRFELSLVYGERALVALDGTADLVSRSSALHSLARTHLELGDDGKALRLLRKALAIVQRCGARREEAQLWNEFGELYRRRGDLIAAEHAYRQILPLVRMLRDQVGEAFARRGMGWCQLRLRRHAEAERNIGAALRIFREAGTRDFEAGALVVVGELRRAQGEHTLAIEAMREAVSLWTQPIHRARTLRALGDTYQGIGEIAEALAAWEKSHAIFAELGSAEATELAGRMAAATG